MPRLLLASGYLGAGKTSLLLAAATQLRAAGHRVAMVTNDQGSGLVDTWTAELAGLPVSEVPDGCFCCRLGALVDALGELRRADPDVILAEPSGSCADLQAAVVGPLARLGGLQVLPLTVAVEPACAAALAAAPATDALHYLWERQLAEAERILLTKTDLLAPAEAVRLQGGLRALFPGTPVLPVCAPTGAGIAAWLASVWEASAGGRPLDLDPARYAAAEAALAWLDAAGQMSAASALPAQAVGETLLRTLGDAVTRAGGRIAVAKCLLRGTGPTGRILHLDAGGAVRAAPGDDMLARRLLWRLNVRAAMVPEALSAAARRAVAAVCQEHGAAVVWERAAAFSPVRARGVPR